MIFNGPIETPPQEHITVCRFDDGSVELVMYYLGYSFHRDPKEGPAEQLFFSNGSPRYECYWVNGNIHRDPFDGPAEIYYTEDTGDISLCLYYVRGVDITQELIDAGAVDDNGKVIDRDLFEYYASMS